MKLNTLYKSVSIESSVPIVLCTRQTYADTRPRVYAQHLDYVRMRVVVHSLATNGANTTRSAGQMLCSTFRHVSFTWSVALSMWSTVIDVFITIVSTSDQARLPA